jgi:hypothetical protein
MHQFRAWTSSGASQVPISLGAQAKSNFLNSYLEIRFVKHCTKWPRYFDFLINCELQNLARKFGAILMNSDLKNCMTSTH